MLHVQKDFGEHYPLLGDGKQHQCHCYLHGIRKTQNGIVKTAIFTFAIRDMTLIVSLPITKIMSNLLPHLIIHTQSFKPLTGHTLPHLSYHCHTFSGHSLSVTHLSLPLFLFPDLTLVTGHTLPHLSFTPSLVIHSLTGHSLPLSSLVTRSLYCPSLVIHSLSHHWSLALSIVPHWSFTPSLVIHSLSHHWSLALSIVPHLSFTPSLITGHSLSLLSLTGHSLSLLSLTGHSLHHWSLAISIVPHWSFTPSLLTGHSLVTHWSLTGHSLVTHSNTYVICK